VRRTRDARLLAASLVSLCAAVGCPVFLSDDFKTVPAATPDGGDTADGGAGGAGGTSGAPGGGGVVSGGGTGAMITNPSAGTTGTDAAAGGGTPGSDDGGFGANSAAGGAAGSGAGGAGNSDAGTCAGCDPRWTPTAPPEAAFAAREQAAYTAAGTRVFIWGGADRAGSELATGALYDAELDEWTAVQADASTPSARVLSTAVWTGTTFVVWGGGDHASLTDHATGGRYDPASKKWTTMSTSGAPSARRAPYGVWTGSRVLFWGGVSAAHEPVGGAYSYDPVKDSWTAASVTGEPVAPLNPTVGWTGSTLLVYGGRTGGTSYTARTDGYDPAKDLWTSYPAGPQARGGALGGWDGAAFVVWGGTASAVKKDGQRFSSAKWTNMVSQGEPSGRYAGYRETGWSGRIGNTTTLMVGGYDVNQAPLTGGGYYDTTANAWTAVGAWPSGSAHLSGVGVWAGSAFVLWGGRVGPLGALTTEGERFRP
jgi:hypothetical protein